MKLLDQSLKYLSVSILLIVSIWSVVFYFNMLDEIYDSLDDGLANYKLLIIQKAEQDSTILLKNAFDESNYAINPISKEESRGIRNNYKDTLLYMPFEEDLEPARLLTSVFTLNNNYYRLQVISSMVEEDDLIKRLIWAILWLYFFLMISIVAINNVMLKKLWEPFYNLLQQLKKFRLDKNTTLPEIQTKTKEFTELKNACDTLISHAFEAYSNQKQFTENAAHELQTPLAIISNKLELLLEKNKLENNDAENITQVLQIVSSLIQLNKSLLLLSKIENRQFFDNQKISINKLVNQVIESLQDFAQFKNTHVTIKESDTCTVEMDAMLANILISNLIKNAIFHNIQNGSVKLEIQNNTLNVTNTSESGKLAEKDIFKRFYKGAEMKQNTGLGLAIVQAICRLYGFTISYSYSGEHTFQLRFR